MPTKQEFIAKVKAKYPVYAKIDDNELYDKVIAKYPQYKTQVTETIPSQPFFKGGITQRSDEILKQREQPTWMEQKMKQAGFHPEMGGPVSKIVGRGIGEVVDMARGAIQIPKAIVGLSKMPPKERGQAIKETGKEALASYYTSLRPSKILSNLKNAPVQTTLDILPFIGLAKAGLSLAKPLTSQMKNGLGRVAAKGASFTTGLPEEDILKTLSQPKKYLAKPMNKFDELTELGKYEQGIVKGMDDIVDFNMNTIEDSVAKQLSLRGTPDLSKNINISAVKTQISKYVNSMNSKKITALTDPQMKKIQALMDDLSAVEHKTQFGTRSLPSMTFEEAHNMKKTIYREMKNSYLNPEYGDKVANAYKLGAKSLNAQLRTVEEYATANDKVKAIYDLAEELGKKGFGKFEGIGSEKALDMLYNTPSGRKFLETIDTVLPKQGKFMGEMGDLKNTQRIQKGWQSRQPQNPLIGYPLTAGVSGLGYAAGGIPGGAIGAGVGYGLSTPKGMSNILTLLEKLSSGVKTPLDIAGMLGEKTLTPAGLGAVALPRLKTESLRLR